MKSRSHFQFRQFSVNDDRCSMKVGTDAVLLAAWADLRGAQRVLDIGTGSGVIALIAAQRTPVTCLIDGVEVQEADCLQAIDNAAASPWRDRVRMICSALQDYDPPFRYDVILCNPPYFINSLRPPGDGRTTARHAVTLDHAALITSVCRLLTPSGNASFIMPPEEGNQFKISIEAAGLRATRICAFRTRREKGIERILMTFARAPLANDSAPGNRLYGRGEPVEATEILLYEQGNHWSSAYADLTRDLYLARS
jgi:tRNA1Val (adenine37-N6)-methyltransferase